MSVSNNKKKILITGSCGFVFGNFIRRLVYEKKQYQIVSLDKVDTNTLNSMYWNKSHTFHVADICDQHIIDIIFQFEKPDIVIHGAAESSVDNSLNNPNTFINTNVLGTQVIINACLKHNVEKLIYVSTDKVYGQLGSDLEPAFSEGSKIVPNNPYSASKAAGELLVKAAHCSHGLIYNITRSSNNYGPRQTVDKFIPKTIKCILNGQKIPIYGNGLQMRDWTHVADNCDGILSVLENGIDNETYNISSGLSLHNIELVQKICNIMGKGHDLIDFVEDKPGHEFRYAGNNEKITNLGWKPSYKFKDGIASTVEWYLSNQWFLK